MYDIILKGLAGNTSPEWVDKEEFHNVECDECFSEYFGEDEEPLINKRVRRGYMKFSYEGGKLYVVVKYRSDKRLDIEEVELLKDYTQGQLSDGIGEGFEQFPCLTVNDEECYISPWFWGQILEVEQIEIN